MHGSRPPLILFQTIVAQFSGVYLSLSLGKGGAPKQQLPQNAGSVGGLVPRYNHSCVLTTNRWIRS